MKRHLLGFLLFLCTFAISFYISPVRFSLYAVGSSTHGGFSVYDSTYFEKVTIITERQTDDEEAKKTFKNHLIEYEEIVIGQKQIDTVYRNFLTLEKERAIFRFETESDQKGFCVIRKDERWVFEICSTSLWHILEFEKQNFYNIH